MKSKTSCLVVFLLTLAIWSQAQAGAKLWEFATGADILSSPAVARDGTVYVGSGDGRLYALGGASGLAVSSWPMFRKNHRHTAKYFPKPNLTPKPGGDGLTQLVLSGEPGQNYEIEASSDLRDWRWLGSFLSLSSATNVVDLGSGAVDKRFYRVWSR